MDGKKAEVIVTIEKKHVTSETLDADGIGIETKCDKIETREEIDALVDGASVCGSMEKMTAEMKPVVKNERGLVARIGKLGITQENHDAIAKMIAEVKAEAESDITDAIANVKARDEKNVADYDGYMADQKKIEDAMTLNGHTY